MVPCELPLVFLPIWFSMYRNNGKIAVHLEPSRFVQQLAYGMALIPTSLFVLALVSYARWPVLRFRVRAWLAGMCTVVLQCSIVRMAA